MRSRGRCSRGERGRLSPPRLHRPRDRISRHARRAWRGVAGRAHTHAGESAVAAENLHRDRRRDGDRDALQRLHGLTVTSNQSRVSDDAVEQLIGRLLQIGVLIAAAITLVGGTLLLIQHGRSPVDYSTFRGEPVSYTHLTLPTSDLV